MQKSPSTASSGGKVLPARLRRGASLRCLRAALMSSAAASSVWLGLAAPAQAACVGGGTPAIACTGDLTAGVSELLAPADATLTISGVTTGNIAQGAGTAGVTFTSVGVGVDLILNSNTNPFAISTTAGADGIVITAGDGSVTVTHDGAITAAGAGADGIVAVSGSTVDLNMTGNIMAASTAISANANGAVTIGSTGVITATTGAGIAANSATGDVTITSAGNVTGADAIVADASGAITIGSTGVITATTGTGITANSTTGGVAITSAGNITADGAFGSGIAASVGTGPLTVNSSGIVHARLSGISADATNGAVFVNNIGNVTSTTGDAIRASAGSVGNTVIVASTGDLTAGAGRAAISVQNLAGGDLTVNVQGATSDVVGGSGLGAGVAFVGGSNNTLINAGNISAVSGLAVSGTTGVEVINNTATGIISGNVELGAGANAFVNLPSAQFRPGAVVQLGTGTLTNFGTLSPGNSGTIETTGLTGNLAQVVGPGVFAVDINTGLGGVGDRINVTGTATLTGGVVVPTIVNASLVDKHVEILTAGVLDTTNLNTTGLTVVDTSAAYNFQLENDGLGTLFLNIQLASINALLPGAQLTPNQASTVNYVDRLLATNPAPNSPLALFLDSLGGLPTTAQIIAALDRLTPESYAASVAGTMQGSLLFANSLMSCPSANEMGVVHREGQCYWAQAKARNSEWDATTTNVGGSEDATGITGGMQSFVAPDWLLGGAIAYEQSSADTNNAASSDGDRLSGGFVLKGLYGDTTLATAVFGGVGWYDTERVIALPLPAVTAEGDHDVGFAGTALRLSHVFDYGGWYAKPMIDAGATYFSYGDIRETGAGVANLIVEGESQWLLNVGAALELGRTFAIQPGLLARPYVRVGVTALSDSDFSLTSRFEGAPGGVAPFTVTSSYDDVTADLAVGMDVFATSGLSVNVAYDGKFGDTSESHAGSAKLRMAF